MKTIYFAGGCFWGVERLFQRLDDSIITEVGYAQSDFTDPSYEQVVSKMVQAIETVEIKYDPEKVSLLRLLDVLFLAIDPEQAMGQGNDRGYQYQAGVFYLDDEDEPVLKDYLAQKAKEYSAFHVKLEKLDNFYPAEGYHQDYLIKNPTGYCHINFNKVLADANKNN